VAEVHRDSATSLAIAEEWVDAANDRRIEDVVRLSSRDIEIVGPKGSARGADVLRDWIARAGLTLQTLRSFANNKHVVLEQQGTWQLSENSGAPSTALISTHFTIADGRVSRIARFDSLSAALADASLSSEDEIIEHSAI
jgi:hypothetical protein